jgi:hypothetical protein
MSCCMSFGSVELQLWFIYSAAVYVPRFAEIAWMMVALYKLAFDALDT